MKYTIEPENEWLHLDFSISTSYGTWDEYKLAADLIATGSSSGQDSPISASRWENLELPARGKKPAWKSPKLSIEFRVRDGGGVLCKVDIETQELSQADILNIITISQDRFDALMREAMRHRFFLRAFGLLH